MVEKIFKRIMKKLLKSLLLVFVSNIGIILIAIPVILVISLPFSFFLKGEKESIVDFEEYGVEVIQEFQQVNNETAKKLNISSEKLTKPNVDYAISLIHLQKVAPQMFSVSEQEEDIEIDYTPTIDDFNKMFKYLYYYRMEEKTFRVKDGYEWVLGTENDYDKKTAIREKGKITGYIYEKKNQKYKKEVRTGKMYYNYSIDQSNDKYIDMIIQENPQVNKEMLYKQLEVYARSLAEIKGQVRDLNERNFISPVTRTTVNITSPYGWRLHPIEDFKQFHTGIDIAGTQREKLLAIADGVVKNVYLHDTLGNAVEVETDNGFRYVFGHCNQINVKKNERVKQGDVIALMGGAKGTYGAGRSTGSHLHMNILKKINGVFERQNPMKYY